jgi:hypothetical protein
MDMVSLSGTKGVRLDATVGCNRHDGDAEPYE